MCERESLCEIERESLCVCERENEKVRKVECKKIERMRGWGSKRTKKERQSEVEI